MANQKLNFEAALNIDLQLNNQEKIQKMMENLSLVNSELKGVSSGRMKQAQDIQKELAKLESEDPSKMSKEEQVDYQRRLNTEVNKYYALMNSVSAAAIQQLAKTKEQEAALNGINKEYRTTNTEIKNQLDLLGEIAKKSREAKDAIDSSIDQTSKATGIDSSKIRSVTGTNREIKALEGKTDKKSRDSLALLKEHKRVLQEQNRTIKEQERAYEEVNGKLQDNFKKQGEIRARKTEIVQQIIRQANEEGDITDEQKEGLQVITKELDTEEKITAEKKKQKAQEKGSNIQATIKQAKEHQKANEGVKKSFLGKISMAAIYYAALRTLRKLMSSVINTVKELDKSLTEVAMVTSMSRKEAWKLVSAYQNLAHEVGTTTDEIAKLSVYFFRQGRTQKDALELTRVAAIAAKVASIDATESANFLTSAINGFGMAADQALEVSDKFAALAASSASSYQELAVALSKVAPSANMAGVGIDFMMGVIAKGIETTREAPENIGTAFKTIFARMMQIREFGATLDDATGVNKVEEALKQAEVSLRDSTGTFRDMDQVLNELGQKWSTLTRNEQSYIATALAGTRQQTRLLAVMQDYERTVELVNISQNSLGATFAQQVEYAGGMQAAVARLNNA